MMELEDFLISVVASVDIVQENVDDFLQEFSSLSLCSVDMRQQIWKKNINLAF